MKLYYKNNGKEEYLDVSFWSMFKAYMISNILLTAVVYILLFIIVIIIG